MKQRLTKENIKELSPEQLENYKFAWIPQNGDIVVNEFGFSSPLEIYHYTDKIMKALSEHCYPLLDIGRLINYLVVIGGEEIDINYTPLDGLYSVGVHIQGGYVRFDDKELINALWEALKLYL